MRAAFGHPAVIGTGASTIHVNHLPPVSMPQPTLGEGQPMIGGNEGGVGEQHEQQQQQQQ